MNITQAIEILGEKFQFTAEDTHRVIREMNIPENSTILDVGTGIGSLAITLALNGYQVLTGEPADDTTVYAKQDWQDNAQKVGLDHLIQFKPFNATDLPFDDEAFDAIFCLGSFHHIDETQREIVINEFSRALKPHGHICIFEPNPHAMGIIMEADPTHPDAADPLAYIDDKSWHTKKVDGVHFDAFILQKSKKDQDL